MESPEGSPKRTWLKEREQSNYVESVRRNTRNGILLETGTMIRNLGMVRSMDSQTMGELIIGQYQLAVGRGNYTWVGQMQRAATQFMPTPWILENIPQRDPKKNIRQKTPTQRVYQDPEECRDFRLQDRPDLPVLRVDERGSNTQPLNTETPQVWEHEIRPATSEGRSDTNKVHVEAIEDRSDTLKVVSDTHKVRPDPKEVKSSTHKVHSNPSREWSKTLKVRFDTYKLPSDTRRGRQDTHKVQTGSTAQEYREQESWRGPREYRTRSTDNYDSRETQRYREQKSWIGTRDNRTRSSDWFESRETQRYRESESRRGQREYRTRSPDRYDSRKQETWRGPIVYGTRSPDHYDSRETQGYRKQESWERSELNEYRTQSSDSEGSQDSYCPIETQVYTRTPVHDRDLDSPPHENRYIGREQRQYDQTIETQLYTRTPVHQGDLDVAPPGGRDSRMGQSQYNSTHISCQSSYDQAPEVLVEPSDLIVHVREVEVRPKRKLPNQDHCGKAVKKYKAVCPVHGCDHQSGKLKWHVYIHLPKEFYIYSTEDRPEEEFLDRCRIVGLQYLATAILGPRTTLGDLLRFVNNNWDPCERYTVSPEVEEAIHRVHALVGRGILYRIVLSPANSVACLIHWRPMAFLYNHLSEVQREGFKDACSSRRPQGPSPTLDSPSTGYLALAEGSSEVNTPDCDPGTPAELSRATLTPEMEGMDTGATSEDHDQLTATTLAEPQSSKSMSLEAPTSTDEETGQGCLPLRLLPTRDPVDSPAETAAKGHQDDQGWTLVTSQKHRRALEGATGKTYAGVAAGSVPTPPDQTKVPRKTDPSLPKAFDSHFHLDRLNLRLTETITTVEDALDVDVGYGPEHRVALSGGVLVFCDPEHYDELTFPNDPRWRVAVGIHPKKAPSFMEYQWVRLQLLLSDNRVSAVGEIGLDYSVPKDQWPIQEQVLKKVLTVCGLGHVLVLHIRGNKRDPCGIQPHARCLEIVQQQCSKYQRIHIHCFTGDLKTSSRWRNAFPNCYFGFTGLVKRFNLEQRCVVAQLPLDKIIIETDAPYMEIHSGQTVNTPAYIGDVAKAVADLRMMPVGAVLQATDQTGRALYGCRKAY